MTDVKKGFTNDPYIIKILSYFLTLQNTDPFLIYLFTICQAKNILSR